MAKNVVEKLPKLDFLRAISALIVIVYHSGYEWVPAGFGVTVFFVISGFLITYLLVREHAQNGEISLRNFYVRRSLRIFPALYVYWLVAVGALLIHHLPILWPQAICALFYVNNYYQGLHHYPDTLFSHTWSLGVEEQFYLLWPVAFVGFRNSLGKLMRWLLVVIPLLWVLRAALHLSGVYEGYIYTAFETRIDAILVGCALAVALASGAGKVLLEELRRPRYIAVVLVLLAGSLALQHRFGFNYRNVFGFAADPVLIALLVWQLMQLRGAQWMDAKPISYLGRISYSTYLYQQIMLPLLRGRLPHSISLVGCVVAIWCVAALSYEFVEKPFLKLKRRFETVRVKSSAGEPVTGEA